MHSIYEEKRKTLQKQNYMILSKLEDVIEAQKPILDEIDDDQKQKKQEDQQNQYQKQNKIPLFISQADQNVQKHIHNINQILDDNTQRISTLQQQKQFDLNDVQKQHRKLTEKFKVVSKQIEKQSKKLVIKKPEIKTRQQQQDEKNQEKEKKLDLFISQMQEKYAPYLLKTELPKEKEQIKKELYNKQLDKYLERKKRKELFEKGMEQREQKQFDLVHTAKSWKKIQNKQEDHPLIANQLPLNESYDLEEEEMLHRLLELEEKERVVQAYEKILLQILKEKKSEENKLFLKHKDKILEKIWKHLDQDDYGYISKEEFQNYMEEYPILIAIFDIKWEKFQVALIQMNTKRKGLVTNKEFLQIINNKKLKKSYEEILKDLQDQNIESQVHQFNIPSIFKNKGEKEKQEEEQEEQEKEEEQNNERDPNIDYQQLDQLTQINHDYINKHYPPEKVIKIPDYRIVIEPKKVEKKLKSQEYIKWARDMNAINHQYRENKLPVQQDEYFQKRMKEEQKNFVQVQVVNNKK